MINKGHDPDVLLDKTWPALMMMYECSTTATAAMIETGLGVFGLGENKKGAAKPSADGKIGKKTSDRLMAMMQSP